MTIAQGLIRFVLAEPDRSRALQVLAKNQKAVAQSLARTRTADLGPTPVVVSGRIMTGGVLAYLLGAFTGQLWLPAVGITVGIIGALAVATGFQRFSDAHRNFLYLKTYLTALRAMMQADRVISPEEERFLADLIAGLPVTEAERRDLLALQASESAEFEIPDWLEDKQRREILIGVYSMAYCDGIAPPEEELFGQLAARLGVTGPALEQIRKAAVHHIDELERLLIVAGGIVLSAAPHDKSLREFVRTLTGSLLVRRDAHATCHEALARTVADLETKGDVLFSCVHVETVLGVVAIIAKAASAGIETPDPPLWQRHLEIARIMGIENEALRDRALIEGIFAQAFGGG